VKNAALLLLSLCLLSTGCSVLGKMEVGRVLASGRDGWQLPERVVESLGLKPGDHVAEIGAGDGYWLPWLSAAVGPEGRVYAVEVTDELVAALERRVSEQGWANVIVVRGRFEDPELPDGRIDLALTCLTYHHIDARPAYFAKIQRDLSSDGRVAHVDGRHDLSVPFRWAQTEGHWFDPDQMVTEMKDAGFRRTLVFDYLPMQNFQVFEPVSREPQPAAPGSRVDASTES
jgi:predicted methyltransferase